MPRKRLLWSVGLVMAILAAYSIVRIDHVSAQQAGEAGFGGAGGAGGEGGAGGGGGSGGVSLSRGGALAAYGEYVYVLQQGTLYQYAAYDLALVKTTKVRQSGRRRAVNPTGRGFGGGGGGGRGGNGAPGGEGGQGGGFQFGGVWMGSSEAIAAYGEYVYVLQGETLHKLAADGLVSEKTVTLKFDDANGQ